jgi:hypothetical protein
MKKSVKFLLTVSILLVLTMILSGCSGNDLDGTWLFEGRASSYITFDGSNFTTNLGRSTFGVPSGSGTFSITQGVTNDNIEFIFSNGEVLVREFTRTENAITIRGGSFRFTLARG